MSIFGNKYPLIYRNNEVAQDLRHSLVIADEPETHIITHESELTGERFSFVRGQRWRFEVEINLHRYAKDKGFLLAQYFQRNLGALDFIIHKHYDGGYFADENGLPTLFTLTEVTPFYATEYRYYDRLRLVFISNNYATPPLKEPPQADPDWMRTYNFTDFGLGAEDGQRVMVTDPSGRWVVLTTAGGSVLARINDDGTLTQVGGVIAPMGSGSAYGAAFLGRGASMEKKLVFAICYFQAGIRVYEFDPRDTTADPVVVAEHAEIYVERCAFDMYNNILHVAMREHGVGAFRYDKESKAISVVSSEFNGYGLIRNVAVMDGGEYIVAGDYDDAAGLLIKWNKDSQRYFHAASINIQFFIVTALSNKYFAVLNETNNEILILKILPDETLVTVETIQTGVNIIDVAAIGRVIYAGIQHDGASVQDTFRGYLFDFNTERAKLAYLTRDSEYSNRGLTICAGNGYLLHVVKYNSDNANKIFIRQFKRY